jgi:5-methylcytosine-specific restriction endonuclease McrA
MVIKKLGLVPAGGNYDQVKRYIAELNVNTDHFTGMGWNTGVRKITVTPAVPLEKLLTTCSPVQSYKLKKRLFDAGLKEPKCELCGWSEKSVDGRIPVELDHINGIREDNRITNLRILCPNCHSLQLTHRGRNKKARLIKYI